MKTSIFMILLLVAVANAASNKPTTRTTQKPTTTTNSTKQCEHYTSCDDCVQNSKGKCVYCNEEKKCKTILSKNWFSKGGVCKGGTMEARWLTCSVNMMALIIGISVVGGVLIISICACICCCCCCKDSARQKLKWMRQDAAAERRNEERKAQYAQRRAERQAKNDEIRKKYGLFRVDQGGYQRMEDGA